MRLSEARTNSARRRLRSRHLAELERAFEEESPLTYGSSGGDSGGNGGIGGGDAASSVGAGSLVGGFDAGVRKSEHLANLQLMFEEEGSSFGYGGDGGSFGGRMYEPHRCSSSMEVVTD